MNENRCASCDLERREKEGACSRCGWDPTLLSRKCTVCRENVTLAPDTKALRVPFLVTAAVGLGIGFMGGFLGAAAILSAIVAVGRFVMARSVAFRCSVCNQVLSMGLVSPKEREQIPTESAALRLQALGFLLVSVVAGTLFFFVVSGRFRAPTEATVNDLKEKGDAAGLVELAPHEDLGMKAIMALASLGPEGVRATENLLHHRETRVRRGACVALEKTGASALPALVTLMDLAKNDSDVQTRTDAVNAIGAMGPDASQALPLLEELAGTKEMKYPARAALRKVGAPRAVGRE